MATMAYPQPFAAISPWLEMGAYEALWSAEKPSFKRLAETFKAAPEGSLPSTFVTRDVAEELAQKVMDIFRLARVDRFGVSVYGSAEYPKSLRKAQHPIELLYYQGWWDLIYSPSVAVVGTRKPTPEGIARTRKLVKSLVTDDFTVVSGLAQGIDTEAHKTAIASGGRTIAVIGTPLNVSYPAQNAELQRDIAKRFLVVSQVPVLRYSLQTPFHNKFFFPARNITMAALSLATVIVEAGESSGTLVQARAALSQGKKLFILDSCFADEKLTWPARFLKQGGIRVKDYSDIRSHLVPEAEQN